MTNIDKAIAEIEAAIEKLGGVQKRLREVKSNAEALEKARDSLREANPKSDKDAL